MTAARSETTVAAVLRSGVAVVSGCGACSAYMERGEKKTGCLPWWKASRAAYPRRESNSNQKFRKLLFYPLNYKGIC